MSDEAQREAACLTMGVLLRLATGPDGLGPSAATIHNYIRDGLLRPAKDSTGRYLFRRSDAAVALQIYNSRRLRHGATGRRPAALAE